jgi:aminoglycoside phosphotransferase family enzyme/predicted kinase
MQSASEHEAIAEWLSRPEAYPHQPESVEEIETHISHVFVAGELVYKLKKPVKYDFLDYTTLEAREQACREELRLNRRLAADTYLRVVPVKRGTSSGYELDGRGEAVDWVVEMQRLPTELTLEALFKRGKLRPEHMERLAVKLAEFYGSLTPVSLTVEEYRQRCVAHVHANLSELLSVKHHLPRGAVERVHGFQLQLLNLCPKLLEQRVQEGRFVDGHGDLRPEHICLSDPIRIFDCIEFSADFRRMDVADELAFLAAECDFLGADWAGRHLIAAYELQTGDRPAPVLLDFYKCYRACVRAKVAALRADQVEGEAQESAAGEAQRHLGFADRYAAPWLAPLVICVGGLAGTGKTTLARALAEILGAEVLRTDEIRREIFGAGPYSAEVHGGSYAPEARERVYDEMFKRAAALHSHRISIVLDGTFSMAAQIRKGSDLATDSGAVFLAIECVCPPEVARERISRRLAMGRDASEARPEIHDIQRNLREIWPRDVAQIRIDSGQSIERQADEVLKALGTILQGCAFKNVGG